LFSTSLSNLLNSLLSFLLTKIFIQTKVVKSDVVKLMKKYFTNSLSLKLSKNFVEIKAANIKTTQLIKSFKVILFSLSLFAFFICVDYK